MAVLLSLTVAIPLSARYRLSWLSSEVRVLGHQRDSMRADLAKRTDELYETESKYEVVNAYFPQDRIYWSEKLNIIAAAARSVSVSVIKIELTEQRTEREPSDSVKRRRQWKLDGRYGIPPPQPVCRPIFSHDLIIEFYAHGSDSSQLLRQINNFYESLRSTTWTRANGEDTTFFANMDVIPSQSVQRTETVSGVEVLHTFFMWQCYDPGEAPEVKWVQRAAPRRD